LRPWERSPRWLRSSRLWWKKRRPRHLRPLRRPRHNRFAAGLPPRTGKSRRHDRRATREGSAARLFMMNEPRPNRAQDRLQQQQRRGVHCPQMPDRPRQAEMAAPDRERQAGHEGNRIPGYGHGGRRLSRWVALAEPSESSDCQRLGKSGSQRNEVASTRIGSRCNNALGSGKQYASPQNHTADNPQIHQPQFFL